MLTATSAQLPMRPAGRQTPPDPEGAGHLMLRVLAFAELVGLLDATHEPRSGVEVLRTAVDGLHGLGVGRHVAGVSAGTPSSGDVARLAGRLVEAIDGSPMPVVEWPALVRALGEDLLADLVGVSLTSVRRYASGARRTPDDVAGRLHTVALLVASLTGSYNDVGVRRWFHRPRTALGGKAPADLLAGDWSPDDADVVAVRRLADSLLGAFAG